MKHKYQAKFSIRTATRTSPRTYTHAWLVFATDNIPDWWNGNNIAGGGFSATEELARKAANSTLAALRKWKSPPVAQAEIVPVEVLS